MMSLILIIIVLILPFSIPLGIIAIVVHFVNKRDRQKRGAYGQNPPTYDTPDSNTDQNQSNYSFGNETEYIDASPVSGTNSNEPAFDSRVQDNYSMEKGAAEYSNPDFNNNNSDLYYYSEPKKVRTREPLSSSTIMLLIGTALVVLSGLAFGAANWVNTSPAGRVGIICIASVVSFLISSLFQKAVKLKGTSSAFYIVGSLFTSVALIIASFYNMLGKWLSFDGNGRSLLFAIAFAMTAAACFIGYNIYKTKPFIYTALSMSSLSMFFVALQTGSLNNKIEMEIFTSVLIILQALITAAIHLFRVHEKSEFASSIKLIADITASIYAAICGIYALSTTGDATFATYFITAIVMLQLIGYGIYKNKEWMIGAESAVAFYLSIIISLNCNKDLSPDSMTIICAYLFFIVFLIHRFVPQLKNTFTVALTLLFTFIGSMMTLSVANHAKPVFAYTLPAITAIIIYIYTYHKQAAIQIASGIVSSFIPAMIAITIDRTYRVSPEISDEKEHIIYGLAAIILTLITLFIQYLPKIAFEFHSKHPRQSDTVLYSGIITSALMLLSNINDSEYAFIPIIAAILHFFAANTLNNNFFAAGSLIALIGNIICILETAFENNETAVLTFDLIIFVMIMALSKILFRKALISRKDGKLIFDVALMSGWTLIIHMGTVYEDNTFFVLLSLAIYIACFVKKNTSQNMASLILTLSAFLAAMALINRPFFVVDNEMISNKITFAIFAILGTAYRVIWRHHKEGAKYASNIVFILTFIALIFDALYFSNVGNTVFTLTVTTLIIIVSFMIKSKTWFAVSSISLLCMILYSAKDFLSELSGWVYLLAAGLILIAIASINEYYKQKGENVKSKFVNAFSDWNW